VGGDDDDAVATVADVAGDRPGRLAILHHVEQRGRAGEPLGKVAEVGDLGDVARCDAPLGDHADEDQLGGEPLGEIGGERQRPLGQLRAVEAGDQSSDALTHLADGWPTSRTGTGEARTTAALTLPSTTLPTAARLRVAMHTSTESLCSTRSTIAPAGR
jgi:hypothetical protein